MLVLQKASAGSGKTYTLARQYIIFLITIRDEDGSLRLRTREELDDAARHILAITFTNKATAEMKERIVMRLADLANRGLSITDTPYLEDIISLTGTDEHEVRTTATMALALLLNNYSDFKVSTIDSFFQSILRTFAYEIGMNDSYGLEMDADFIAVSSFDATLSDVNSGESNRRVRDWLSALMNSMVDNKELHWNLFTKSGKGSLYDSIIQAIKKMAGESFKLLREELRAFYDSRGDTLGDYRELEKHFNEPLEEALKRGRDAANDALTVMDKVVDDLAAYVEGRVLKMKAATLKRGPKFNIPQSPEEARYAAFKKKVPIDSSPEHTFFADAYERLARAKKDYDAVCESTKYKLWQLYKENFRFLPLMLAAAEKSAAMLAANNVVDISETNAILNRVIGDDDAPFIYERMGTRLHHYLIDEFQDTSKMQWQNLRPLIDESMSHDYGNLIIGDAKQSIYRFRNADPSLISTEVPSDYPHQIVNRGANPKENTNHRSLRTIVETNNTIFHAFARRMDEWQHCKDHFFANLYSNTAQCPAMTHRLGYFHFEFVKNSNKSDSETGHFSHLGELIMQLLSRGYKMADIAILVRKNNIGDEVVQALREYNYQNPSANIAVISEESLLIGGSQAVKSIVSVIRLISEGALLPEQDTNKTANNHDHREKMSLALFTCRYQLTALNYPHFAPEEIIAHINAHPADDAPLKKLLQSVDSLTLPSLVESIVMMFISKEIRKSEAPFIAAFQDMVLDYCERYSSDILSFLQWWEIKSPKASISSPQGLDAVTVMTIHKAKGLEYKCVIIPELLDWMNPKNTEWLWVTPDKNALGLPDYLSEMLPARLPVVSSKTMLQTPHHPIYSDYLRQYSMDVINNWYVAFTRAVAELYVFTNADSSSDEAVATQIANCLVDAAEGKSEAEYAVPSNIIKVVTTEKKEAEVVKSVSVGSPLTPEEIKRLDKKNDEDDEKREEIITLDEYYVTDPRDVLHFRDPDAGYSNREEPDPRAIGNQLHDIMAGISTLDDLHRAVRTRMVNGFLSRREADEALRLLKEKLADPRVAAWFKPGIRVINERQLLAANGELLRPDRIIVDDDDRATVIDYKFGLHRNDSSYRTQVRQYMNRLKQTWRFSQIKGYVWYVMRNEILEITLLPEH